MEWPISIAQLLFLGVKAKECGQQMEKTKVAWNCLIYQENWSKRIFEIVDQIFFGLVHFKEGGRSTLEEAVAHAPPTRRGARSTPRGYAPLKSDGFFYWNLPLEKNVGQKGAVNSLIYGARPNQTYTYSPIGW